ncbi:NEAT domain-containing protein [Leuconostoc falkenbergense]|uniref:NEAT domain-containing protein n=1 Tax=Leuconostoc falkenbergense TaxID=2766470 RepID=UPI001968920C|nr:NEAT domain-containing protein [Leuconostoc falkenbergense]QSB51072.1 NEAT domain-containing protein [Leuconostoc falkenbergense]
MEKNKVLVLAGTLAVSGAMLLHSDVVIAASTTGSATVANTAASNLQNGSYTATAKLYKAGTTNDSMMSSMVLPTANVVIKNEQAIITLQFKDMATIDMVKSWVIDGVAATKSGQSFVVVLPASDLGKTLKSTIHVETMLGTLPFSETQPVDLLLTPKDGTDDDTGNGDPAPSVPESVGHDVPLTAQLSSTSKLPNTATNETTTAPLLAALVSGVLALGIWFKKVLR